MYDGLKGKKEKYIEHVQKCQYVGCPIKASVLDGDGHKCSFHETPDYHQDVTESVKSNIKFIGAYSTMVKWDAEKWIENDSWLKTNVNIKMVNDEPYSVYLNRYWQWLTAKVRDDSISIINSRLGR